MAYKRQVFLIESERGWGSKVDEILYFDNDQLAKDYIKEFNSKNTANSAPDWYMRAELGSIVDVVEPPKEVIDYDKLFKQAGVHHIVNVDKAKRNLTDSIRDLNKVDKITFKMLELFIDEINEVIQYQEYDYFIDLLSDEKIASYKPEIIICLTKALYPIRIKLNKNGNWINILSNAKTALRNKNHEGVALIVALMDELLT